MLRTLHCHTNALYCFTGVVFSYLTFWKKILNHDPICGSWFKIIGIIFCCLIHLTCLLLLRNNYHPPPSPWLFVVIMWGGEGGINWSSLAGIVILLVNTNAHMKLRMHAISINFFLITIINLLHQLGVSSEIWLIDLMPNMFDCRAAFYYISCIINFIRNI